MDKNEFTENAILDEELTQVSGGAYVGPCIVYTIQRGDTLKTIAERYGTTVDILMALNNIADMNRVYAGHKLMVPAR